MEFLNDDDINKKSKEYYNKTKDIWRDNFHFEPPFGLINDPNGLSYYKGEYYIFFQWNPYGCEHKNKHWGIVKTRNFKDFSIPKIALTPKEYFDKDGCYSGGAIVKGGNLQVFYTGNVKGDKGERISYQCKGILEENGQLKKIGPVISTLPKGYTAHFRDPYIWENNGYYYMILGIQTEKLKGRCVIYKSNDLDDWKFYGELKTSYEDFGFMWECPSFLKIDNKDIFIFSPQGIKEEEFRYQNIYQSGYLIGNLNYDTLEFKNNNEFKELDMGFDFYAPQVFKDEKGRNILIGWMGLPEKEEFHCSRENGWIFSLTMPRELTLKNGILHQNPIEEIRKLRGDKIVSLKNTFIEDLNFSEVKENSYELKLDIERQEASKIEINFMESDEEHTSLTYDFKKEICIIDRNSMINGGKGIRKFKLHSNGNLKINMFVDKSSVEIYFQDGIEVASLKLYPKKDSFNLSLKSEEGKIKINSLNVWEMNEVNYNE
ncbi:sucrose-6-phosphate hydrolase [Clostridium perfringens]|uniref:glycoside hydrolase family 32 protein n=1 Tax=Clostridium perfringens TaxID=1502 RepID=UPI0018E433BE|nr:sucrose-6-phosphate hydrolase [Clostridium perfringens]MBI5984775.1 sucrose-6-phosphate hydrolase [Clostridium perfringens]MBI6051682.1 sucrose-6-phosphate hydrolase [Clostridium perfringens]MDK0576103.1 sucrose-6-phosphate hydrolase [Clostridium perfringens]MDK0579046.1 sucrose-6-phosphate hydrolase [Clostridium perfringens]MDK0731715.1 sucrose-6-phosphate hydrolase [Clostridium perfringens]